MQLLIVVVSVLITCVLSVKIQPRIFGGRDARPTDFKYQAKIFVKENYFSLKAEMCGGSLIHENWVLTAAHCFQYGNIVEVFLGLNMQYSYTQMHYAKQVIIHESYLSNGSHVLNDIALIEIPSIKYGTFIKYIPLFIQKIASFAGETITVAGWGKTEYGTFPTKLQYATLRVLKSNECKNILGNIFQEEQQFCATAVTRNPCIGDSGGAAVIGFGRNTIQIGLVSYGVTECSPNFPAAFTRVGFYLPWIKRNMCI